MLLKIILAAWLQSSFLINISFQNSRAYASKR